MRIIIAITVFAATAGILLFLNSGSATPLPSITPSIREPTSLTPSTIPTTSLKKLNTTIKPVATPSPSFDISILSSLPLTFKIKTTANLKIQTLPQAQCAIKVILPSGSTSGAGGLVTKSTDLTGYTSWSWNISWNTKPGNGKINLNCTKDEKKSSLTTGFTIN